MFNIQRQQREEKKNREKKHNHHIFNLKPQHLYFASNFKNVIGDVNVYQLTNS